MNNQTTSSNQRLTLISKNDGIHVGWVEETQASPAPMITIQLELDFNQSITDNKWTTNHTHYYPNSATTNFNSYAEHQRLRTRSSWSPGLSRRTHRLRRFNGSWMRFGRAWRGLKSLGQDFLCIDVTTSREYSRAILASKSCSPRFTPQISEATSRTHKDSSYPIPGSWSRHCRQLSAASSAYRSLLWALFMSLSNNKHLFSTDPSF